MRVHRPEIAQDHETQWLALNAANVLFQMYERKPECRVLYWKDPLEAPAMERKHQPPEATQSVLGSIIRMSIFSTDLLITQCSSYETFHYQLIALVSITITTHQSVFGLLTNLSHPCDYTISWSSFGCLCR
jgi:hypothetical protein